MNTETLEKYFDAERRQEAALRDLSAAIRECIEELREELLKVLSQ